MIEDTSDLTSNPSLGASLGKGYGSGDYLQNICECGCYQQAHEIRENIAGHGACRFCDCERFTWARFSDYRTHKPLLR